MDPLKPGIAPSLTSSQPPNAFNTKKVNSDTGFADRLRDAIWETNQSQIDADKSIEQVVQGTLGIHEGMLKIQEADISLRLLLQVRAKAMEAYRQIINMSF